MEDERDMFLTQCEKLNQTIEEMKNEKQEQK